MDKYESPSAIAAYRSPFWPKMSNVGNHQSVNICSTSTNFPFLLPINNVTDFDASNNREDDLLGAPSMESTRPDRIVRIDVKFAVWSSQWHCSSCSTGSRKMCWKCENCDSDLKCRTFITAQKHCSKIWRNLQELPRLGVLSAFQLSTTIWVKSSRWFTSVFHFSALQRKCLAVRGQHHEIHSKVKGSIPAGKGATFQLNVAHTV